MDEKLQFILGLKDEWSEKISKAMEASEEFSFSIDQLKNQLETVEKVRTGTKIAYEFDVATEASNYLKEKISQLENGISVDFEKSGRSVNDLRQQIQKLSQARDLLPKGEIAKIRQHNDEVRKLTHEVNKLQNATSKSKVRGWFEDAFKNIPFAGLLKNPLVLAGGIASNSIRKGMQRDFDKHKFAINLGSVQAADSLFDDIGNIMMDQSALAGAAEKMLDLGVNANKITPLLTQMADVVGGDANQLTELSTAFAKLEHDGELTDRRLRQLKDAGFDPLAEIARTTGKSYDELRESLADGGITANMVADAFKTATEEGGQFHNGLEKMNNTLRGKFNVALIKLENAALNLYNVLEPIVSVTLDAFVGMMTMASDVVMWFVDEVKDLNLGATALGIALASLILGMIAYTVKTKVQVLWSKKHIAIQKMQTFWNNITSKSWWKLNAAMLANPVTWITTLVVGLIAVIAYLIEKVDGWGEAWDHTVKGAKLIFEAWVESVKFRFNTVVNGIMIGINKIKEGWYSFRNAVGLGNEAENNAALDAIKADTKARMDEIEEGYEKMKDLAAQSKEEFLKAGDSLSFNDKTVSDIMNKYKLKFGIADPKVPGAVIEDDEKELDKELSKTNETIATGGQKNTTINIDFKNFVENLKIEGKTFKESASQMQESLEDSFLRVLAMAATTAG